MHSQVGVFYKEESGQTVQLSEVTEHYLQVLLHSNL